jgi:hypothetical protein
MYFKPIIKLLSNHRNPNNLAIPTTLNKSQIILLIRSSLPPNQSQNNLQNEIQKTLWELEAQGEILSGGRNRYCMAPPTVLTLERENLNELIFRGDRAYLSLAHQVLKTEQNLDTVDLRPKITQFERITTELNRVNIRFLTITDSVKHLPRPQKPSKTILRSPWQDNPFERETIFQYVPKSKTSQKERWTTVTHEQLSDSILLKLSSTEEYIWFQDKQFYELEPDTALLAMFYLDKEMECPIQVEWDSSVGKLNLQGVILPNAYARWLWQLSQPDTERYRTRCIKPINYPLVERAFQRLGVQLV